MSRSYATINVGINLDEDYITLTVGAKAVYGILVTQADIQACGLLPLTLRRWARALNDDDRPHLSKWLNELQAARFILVDKDTEELLVRTFAKWDGGYKNAKRRLAVIHSANACQSPHLRDALRAELAKLGLPDCPSADRTRIGPATNPVGTPIDPASNAHPSPIERGSDGDRTPIDPPRSVVTLGDNNRTPHSMNLGEEPAANERGEEPSPHCSKHPEGTDQPCGPCGQARETRKTWEADQTRLDQARERERILAARAIRAQHIRDCDLCNEDGYRHTQLDGRTHTGGPCNHRPLTPGGLARAQAALQEETA